jgi:dihydrofolate synthase/folylpolyglutamate synthase
MSAEVLASLGYSVNDAALLAGIRNARLAGRMELIPGSPPLILDGAHNPAGAAALAESLASCGYSRLLLVIGVMSDKDVSGIVSLLTPLAESCYCVCPAVERAMKADTLAGILTGMGIDARSSGSVAEGIIAAQADAAPDVAVVVCGSLFTVGEAKAWLAGRTFEGIRG